jgi:two-component system, cell cycle sensor histidine kinase and response regulator CckA
MQYSESRVPLLVIDSNFIIQEASSSARSLVQPSKQIIGTSLLEYLENGFDRGIRIPAELHFRSFHTEGSSASSVTGLLASLGGSDSQKRYIVFLHAEDSESLPGEHSSPADIQSSKLQALGTLAGGVAHDLNNLLMAVLGHLSYLRISHSELEDESLHSAEEGARMAARLSQQILDFARRQQVAPDHIDICKGITSAIPLISPSLPDGIQVSFKAIHSPLFVAMDESQITQIVLNLLVNARDAMGSKGKVSIEVDRMVFKSGRSINGFTVIQGEYARIQVHDTGHGISDEIREKIFEPFFTTKRGTGTGLGLATVFFLVKSLRGAIDVRSEEGKGTVFSVLIPLCETGDSSGSLSVDSLIPDIESTSRIEFSNASAPDTTSGLRNNNFKILVVDDEDAVRMVLQKSLELLGYTVVSAENGVQAIEIYTSEHSSISLVVMDMIMPQMPGYELFYELKKINPEVRVLISSGYSSDAKTQELLANGARGFIQKPFAVEELAHEVERCLST